MNGKGSLRLDFLDVYGNRPTDRVDVSLKHTVLAVSPKVRDHTTSKRLVIADLEATQGGMYSVLVYPMRHRPVSRFVRIREGQTTNERLVLPIEPDKVSEVEFPSHDALPDDLKKVLEDSKVEGYEEKQGADLFQVLDNFRKAGLLNLYWKMQRTSFQNGRNVFSYASSLKRARGDRIFVTVQKDLRDEVKNSISYRLFHEVSGALHTPPPEYSTVDSFKTRDKYGNLQLTFFAKASTLEFLVDADIDDAQGVEHVFQVVGHSITGGKTHPYDIHEILTQHQGIDPGYRLIV